MTDAICKELSMRSAELKYQSIETIYFGGGTPSVLNEAQLTKILDTIYKHYQVTPTCEITIEINPDDVTEVLVKSWINNSINRISIGVQSFDETSLKWMNRSHTAKQSVLSIYTLAELGFENISMDLIYGLPGLSIQSWQLTLRKVVGLPIQHVSAYCLTVEPKTALQHFVSTSHIVLPSDDTTEQQFQFMSKYFTEAGFIHYEISNFGLPGYHSKHNSSYWKGLPYIGVGPSAHSYDGLNDRRWNIASNQSYLKFIGLNKQYWEEEKLSEKEKYNEFIMTGLRTIWGCDLSKLSNEQLILFEKQRKNFLKHLKNGNITNENNVVKLTDKGRFFADGIAADLFA
jgi:oxygen-independent coproporphyrinogen-3 oxidase